MEEQELVVGRSRALMREAAALGARLAESTGLNATDRRALRLLDALAADQAGRDSGAGQAGQAAAEPLTAGRLATELQLSPAATTALVDRLAAAGFVERVRDLPDRRQVRLRLTDHARQVGAELLAPLARRIDNAAARLDPDQAAVVAGFLADVLAEPSTVEPGPGPSGIAATL